MDDVADNEAREAPPTLGALLVRGREDQGLTRGDVAQRLHMSPSQVEALEMGEYGRLPKGPFLRGFVRNYAKLVGLDPEGLLPLLAEGAPRETAPRIVVPTQNIRFDPLGQRFSGPWVRAGVTAVVVIALAFAAMYWWLFVRTEPPAQRQASDSAAVSAPAPAPAQPASPQAVPAALPQAGAGASSPAAMPSSPSQQAQPSSGAGVAPSAAPASSKTEPAVATAAAPSPQPQAGAPNTATASSSAPSKTPDTKPANVAAAKPVAGGRRLHFRFKGESWVEVRDASGHVVFRQLNPAGSEASVDAKPPLQVVVGNAHEVEMQKDGKPFDLDPEADSDVARFKVE